MIDRRLLLKRSASALALATTPPLARAAPVQHRLRIRTAATFAPIVRSFAVSANVPLAIDEASGPAAPWLLPQHNFDIVAASLDALSAVHPGFAYFGNLPGHLSVPGATLARWLATAPEWADVQRCSGFICLPLGLTRLGRDLRTASAVAALDDLRAHALTCAGVQARILDCVGVATLARAAGADGSDAPQRQADKRFCAPRALANHGRTLAIIMRAKTWQSLSLADQAALQTAARAVASWQDATEPPDAMGTRAMLPHAISCAYQRVAEAVIADISSHDALTRKIDAGYFAARRRLAV